MVPRASVYHPRSLVPRSPKPTVNPRLGGAQRKTAGQQASVPASEPGGDASCVDRAPDGGLLSAGDQKHGEGTRQEWRRTEVGDSINSSSMVLLFLRVKVTCASGCRVTFFTIFFTCMVIYAKCVPKT